MPSENNLGAGGRLPVAYLRHGIEGRSRLAIPSERGDKAYFAAVTDRLREIPGVVSVRASAATGTVLLHHRGDFADVAEPARERRLFDYAPEPEPFDEPRTQIARRVLGAIDREAPRLLPGVFAVLATYRALQGPRFGSAVENFWSSYQLTKFQKRRGWAAVFFAIGAAQLVGGRALGAASSLLFYGLTAHHASRISDPKP